MPRLAKIISTPAVEPSAIPWLTVEQMVQADGLAIHDFGISLLQMIENAGPALADLVQRLAPVGSVTVLAGPGNNSRGVLCAARHLAVRGETSRSWWPPTRPTTRFCTTCARAGDGRDERCPVHLSTPWGTVVMTEIKV